MAWNIVAPIEFWAAFWGAVTAFALEALRRRRNDRRHDAAAGNQAVFLLMQMYIVLSNLKKQLIDDRVHLMRKQERRDPHYFEYQAMSLWWNPDMRLPMDRLGFLLNSYDPDLLNRMANVEHSFFTILDNLARRTSAHLEFTRLASERFGSALPPPRELQEAVGPDVSLRLRSLTELLIQHLPETQSLILTIAGQVSETLGFLFPFTRRIGIDAVVRPFSVDRPSNALPSKLSRVQRGLIKFILKPFR